MLKNFIKDNKFYSCLLLFISICIALAHYFVFDYFPLEPDPCESNSLTAYSAIGKFWEISCSFLTASYTIWFWYIMKFDGKRRAILDGISDKEKQKTYVIVSITSAVGMLIVFCAINISILIYGVSIPWRVFSLVIMVFNCCIFIWMDILVINNLKHNKFKQVKADFKYSLKNIDIPGVITFSFLSIYFVFLHEYPMELFFSGAIAFQMLFSCFA